mmetsp:Transcript_6528/g.11495  ORF Transcript_6528/g.11495 Transcript_6528/m.11495 type:complete len:98 (+) Transcript_6528:1-294(+)
MRYELPAIATPCTWHGSKRAQMGNLFNQIRTIYPILCHWGPMKGPISSGPSNDQLFHLRHVHWKVLLIFNVSTSEDEDMLSWIPLLVSVLGGDLQDR